MTERLEAKRSLFHGVRGLTLFVSVVVIGPYLFGWLTQERGGPGDNPRVPEEVRLDPAALDFGEQPPQGAFGWNLPLTNTTDEQIEVLDFELGCLCTEIVPSAFILAPGETRNVEVVLDLQPRNDDELTKRVREFAGTIKPIFQGGWPKQNEWQLTGRIVNPYVVEPPYIDYGDS